jgi:para-nitrobenzyl esterase
VFTPVFGGSEILPVDPIKTFNEGTFTKVPLMLGVNHDAYRTSAAFLEEWGEPPMTPEGYLAQVRNFAGPDADRVLAAYPPANYPSAALAWSALTTDALLARPMLDTNNVFKRHVPVYAYEFADPHAPWYADIKVPSFPAGSFQDSELQYLFDTTYFAGRTFTPEQEDLSDKMIDYWAQFAHGGNPNAWGSPYWPRANHQPENAQAFAPVSSGGIRQVDFAAEHNYALWRTIPY